ncbi:hypothetical protein D1007_06218 [Hordeum vulgare]|nr:hypothetical protein D1007_06218 [Hordeum vulgare]
MALLSSAPPCALPLPPTPLDGGRSTATGALATSSASPPAPQAFGDPVSGRVLPCIALRAPLEDPLDSFVDQISGRIFPCVVLNALEEDAASLARAAVPPATSSRRERPALPATGVSQAPSWAEVAASGRPRLRSIIITPSASAPASASRQPRAWRVRPPGPSSSVSPAAVPRRPRSRDVAGEGGWDIAISRHALCQARRQAFPPPQRPQDALIYKERGSVAAIAFKRRFGNRCFRCLASSHKFFECRDPFVCYSCKKVGHRERPCPSRSAHPNPKANATPVHPRRTAVPPHKPPPLPCVASPIPPPCEPLICAQPAASPRLSAAAAMALVPGAALQRPAKSSCMVVSTPAMEEEAYRLRTMALLLTAASDCSGITPDMVAEAVERRHRFRFGDIEVAPCFPEDFILTLAERFQRDLVFEARYVEVAGVKFQLRPWFPPPGGHKIWRYYCRVAIDRLPLNAWDWDNVQQVIGQNCKLDLIERQSTTRRNRCALFAWVWTWNPDMIPRASDLMVLSRLDCVRSRELLLEGASVEEGKEGPLFPVLIHLDEVKDYTPLPESDEGGEWPRINRFRDWRLGVKDGESRGRATASAASFHSGRRSDDDRDEGDARRKRGKRGGVRQRLWQRMRDQMQCCDTASFNPAPRQHRHHGEAANNAPTDLLAANEAPELSDAISSADMFFSPQPPDQSHRFLVPSHRQEAGGSARNAIDQHISADNLMGRNSSQSELLSIVSKDGQQGFDPWSCFATVPLEVDAALIPFASPPDCNHELSPPPPSLDQSATTGWEF